MGLAYQNLDEETRRLMLDEIDSDIAELGLYRSSYLNSDGHGLWPELLREAARAGSDVTLQADLTARRCFLAHTQRNKPKGGYTMVAVPVTAAQTLAEAQFNMYYMRALARRAISGSRVLVVYRAKFVEAPRPGSEQMIGTSLDAQFLLKVLRETKGVNPPTGIPLPNTGVTVKLA